MNFLQNLILPGEKQLNYLEISMDNHYAHYRNLKDPKGLTQLDILNFCHELLNSKKLEVAQVRIKRHLFVVIYDVTKAQAKIFKTKDGKFYIHRQVFFCKKDSNTGLLTSLSYQEAQLITQAAVNASDTYNKSFWTILFDNFVNIENGKNIY